MNLSYANNRYLTPLNAKTGKSCCELECMYGIVGNKRRIYSPSFECLILSVDIPEHSVSKTYKNGPRFLTQASCFFRQMVIYTSITGQL